MQLVAGPALFVALAVFLGSDIAVAGKLGAHLIEGLRRLTLHPGRLWRRPFLAFPGAAALGGVGALVRAGGGVALFDGEDGAAGGGSSCFWIGFSRASISLASRPAAPLMRPPSG